MIVVLILYFKKQIKNKLGIDEKKELFFVDGKIIKNDKPLECNNLSDGNLNIKLNVIEFLELKNK